MPSVCIAQKESEQCLAYSRTSHRRCRLCRLHGQKTCSTHKNYYKNWFANHQPWYRLSWLSDREVAEWKFQLQNGYVEVPEVHVRGLQPTFTEYYRFLVTYARVPVEWNTHCLQATLKNMLRTLFALNEGAIRRVKCLLNTPRDCIVVFQQLLYAWIQYLVEMRQETGVWIPYGTAYDILRDVLHGCDEWKQILFSSDFEKILTARATVLHVPGSLLNSVDTQYVQPLQADLLRNLKLHLKSLVYRRISPYHEELMQVTWHPKRVEAMLEAGIEPWDI